MVKITGYLNDVNEYGNRIKKAKIFNKMGFFAKLYFIKMKLLYDWVEIEPIGEDKSITYVC